MEGLSAVRTEIEKLVSIWLESQLTLAEIAADEIDIDESEADCAVAEDPPFSNQYCGG